MAQNLPTLMDGDVEFLGVDMRRAPAQLPPGFVASAVNRTFEYGEIRNRPGAHLPAEGLTVVPVVSGAKITLSGAGETVNGDYLLTSENLWECAELGTRITVGSYIGGTRYEVWNGPALLYYMDETLWPDGPWVVGGAYPAPTVTISAGGYETGAGFGSTVRGMARWVDPEGNDSLVVVTDAIRSSDGGRGQAWRVLSGNAPQEIPLNGHDVWSDVRLVPCRSGLVMLRHGNARAYFTETEVAAATAPASGNGIQLRHAPFTYGDRVMFGSEAGSFDDKLINENRYWVTVNDSDFVQLYGSEALAGSAIDVGATGSGGRYYLERDSVEPSYFGNATPPLILQPEDGVNAWEVGFKSVPTVVEVLSQDADDVLTTATHRLLPGDAFDYWATGATGGSRYYAEILNDQRLAAHPTLDEALAASAATRHTFAVGAEDYLLRAGANLLPMPGGREGIYYKNRLLVVNGQANICISDPLDPLHFTPFNQTLNADVAGGDKVNALVPLGEDTLLVLCETAVLAITGLSGASTTWRLREVTREFGCIAPLSAVQCGQDVWFLSRRGVVSIRQTEYGQQFGVAEPMSAPIQRLIDRIDWVRAPQACGAMFDSQYRLAVPFNGQGDNPVNNAVLVYDFRTKSWHGHWEGERIEPVVFARGSFNGEERLTWCNRDGQLATFIPNLNTDANYPIATEVLTRGYSAGNLADKLWLKGEIIFQTHDPEWSVSVVSEGVAEETVLEANTTKSGYYTPTPSSPAWTDPYRKDYATDGVGIVFDAGLVLDARQAVTEQFRFRITDRWVQLKVASAQGETRVLGVSVAGVPGRQVTGIKL